jgi:hypothetical protein
LLPTRHDEAWRYSDIAAVEAAWPLPAPESIIVPAGGAFARTIVQNSGSIHQLEIAIGKGATAAVHILNIGGDFAWNARRAMVRLIPTGLVKPVAMVKASVEARLRGRAGV